MNEFNFINIDLEEIRSKLKNGYTEITGNSIQEGDAMSDYIDWTAFVMCSIFTKYNETAKETLLRYADKSLDLMGEIVGVARHESRAAATTIKYKFSKTFDTTITIPKGHKTIVNEIVFATAEATYMPIGQREVNVKAICAQAGSFANGIGVGEIKNIVDPIPYLESVSNITITEGGSEAEDNESLRVRIREKPTSISIAGPEKAYEYHTKNAHQDITDVHVSSNPGTGIVDIYPLMKNGTIPGPEIISTVENYFKNKEIKPLTDFIRCQAPSKTNTEINITYYIDESNRSEAELIKLKVQTAVEEYKRWQCTKLGRDINPDRLRWLVIQAGAKRIDVAQPVFRKIENYQVCQITSETINFGGIEDD